MKVAFLPSAYPDLRWFRSYYERTFPEGAENAKRQYNRTLANPKDNPEIGHPMDEPGIRALHVARTPFSFVYRIARGRIEVIHVRDGRSEY
jgi:plasmid stabilization system protein ParE